MIEYRHIEITPRVLVIGRREEDERLSKQLGGNNYHVGQETDPGNIRTRIDRTDPHVVIVDPNITDSRVCWEDFGERQTIAWFDSDWPAARLRHGETNGSNGHNPKSNGVGVELDNDPRLASRLLDSDSAARHLVKADYALPRTNYALEALRDDKGLSFAELMVRKAVTSTWEIGPNRTETTHKLCGVTVEGEMNNGSITDADGKVNRLTRSEYALLMCLIDNEGRTVTIQYLCDLLGLNNVDHLPVSIFRLRKKLGGSGDIIHTERGVGYRLMI